MHSLSEEVVPTHPRDHAPHQSVHATASARQQRGLGLVRIVFGVIWAIDAWFKWQPEFQHNFLRFVQAGSGSQPDWLGPWYQFWEQVLQPVAPFLAICTAVIETLIAAALLIGVALGMLALGWDLFLVPVLRLPQMTAGMLVGLALLYLLGLATISALKPSK